MAVTNKYPELKNGSFKNKKPFTPIPTDILRSKCLSTSAIGLYAIIMSYITIPNFVLYKATLMSAADDGEYSFNRAWRELKAKGYLKQYRIRDKAKNCFIYQYELLEEPDLSTPALINIRIDEIDSLELDEFVKAKNNAAMIPQEEIPEEIKQAENIDITEDEETVEELIKENIGYDYLCAVEEATEVDCIVNIMKEVITSKKEKYAVNGGEIPSYKVKRAFLSLNEEHIQYVLESLRKQSGKTQIYNLRAYIIASLYNSPSTVSISTDIKYWTSHKRE